MGLESAPLKSLPGDSNGKYRNHHYLESPGMDASVDLKDALFFFNHLRQNEKLQLATVPFRQHDAL